MQHGACQVEYGVKLWLRVRTESLFECGSDVDVGESCGIQRAGKRCPAQLIEVLPERLLHLRPSVVRQQCSQRQLVEEAVE